MGVTLTHLIKLTTSPQPSDATQNSASFPLTSRVPHPAIHQSTLVLFSPANRTDPSAMAFQASVQDDASSVSSYFSEATLPVPASLGEDDACSLSSIDSHDSYDSSCSEDDLPS